MSKQAVALIAGLLVVGLLIVGCGGDDDNDASAGSPGAETTSASADADGGGGEADAGNGETDAGDESDEGTAITKAAFIKQADAICTESQRRITAQGTKFFSEAEQKAKENEENVQAELVEVVLVPEYQRVAEELAGLGVPSGDEEAAAFVASYEEFSDTVSSDPQGYLKKGAGVASYETTKELAKSYGFKKCPQGV